MIPDQSAAQHQETINDQTGAKQAGIAKDQVVFVNTPVCIFRFIPAAGAGWHLNELVGENISA
jgi:hypothetical protein